MSRMLYLSISFHFSPLKALSHSLKVARGSRTRKKDTSSGRRGKNLTVIEVERRQELGH